MFSPSEHAARSTDQVSVTVVRKSDGHSLTFVLDEKTHIRELKQELKRRLKPRFEQGCRLIFREKVMKGKHTLKHYGIKKGVNDQAISSKSRCCSCQSDIVSSRLVSAVDDTNEWKSSSSSSDSEHEG